MMRWAIAARIGSLQLGWRERGQRHLKGNANLTDRFAVELVTVQVRPAWHESGSIELKFPIPGLIAYECLSCGYVTSVLIAPQVGDQ
jgi:hypothetical protein